jgi:hypothetical protein
MVERWLVSVADDDESVRESLLAALKTALQGKRGNAVGGYAVPVIY